MDFIKEIFTSLAEFSSHTEAEFYELVGNIIDFCLTVKDFLYGFFEFLIELNNLAVSNWGVGTALGAIFIFALITVLVIKTVINLL